MDQNCYCEMCAGRVNFHFQTEYICYCCLLMSSIIVVTLLDLNSGTLVFFA